MDREVALHYLLYLFSVASHGQVPYWAKDIGGLGADNVADVKAGSDGASYFTGDFTGAFAFGAVSLSSAGSSDRLVGRMDATGALVWMRRAGGTSVDRVEFNGVAYFGGTLAAGVYYCVVRGSFPNGDLFDRQSVMQLIR